jgi:hypothetical protein
LSPAWLAEWSRKHPSGVWPCDRADAMTMCSGTRAAQSDDRARPVAGSCREASAPGGLVTLPAWGGVVAASPTEPGGWASASRWQARVSSLRAIAMVAIFFPRRWAMAA